jgi:hypothetical protein
MIPSGKGRHCMACSTTVTDFSVMTDEEVQNYFIEYQHEKICGRFNNTQLQRIVIDLPAKILLQNMPVWRKILVASLLIFGASIFPFETTIAGSHPQQYYQQQQHQKKSRIIGKQRRKYSSKQRRKNFIDLSKIIFTTTGMTCQNCFPDPKNQTSFLISDKPLFDNSTSVTGHDRTEENRNRKDNTPIPTPAATEFILPVPLALKRFKKKQR